MASRTELVRIAGRRSSGAARSSRWRWASAIRWPRRRPRRRRAAAGRSRPALRAGELRRARRPAEPGGGEHHHHHQRRRGRRRHAAGAAAGLAVRGLLPRLHGPPGRRSRAASSARTRSARASSSRPTATSSPTTTSSRAPTRSRSSSTTAATSRRRWSAATPAPTSRCSRSRATTPLPFVEFGDSDAAQVGDWVLAIGNPLGQGFSVSAGIVSARNRTLQGSYDDFIQTDAAINRGNSGGPLFDMNGRGDRGEHRHPLAQRRLDRHRLRHVGGGGHPAWSTSSATSARPAAAGSACASRTSTRTWPTPSASKAAKGALVTDVPEGPALEGRAEVGRRGAAASAARRSTTPASSSASSPTRPSGETVDVVVFRDGKEDDAQGRGRPARGGDAGRRARRSRRPTPPPAREETVLGMTVAVDQRRAAPALRARQRGDAASSSPTSTPASDAYAKGMREGDVIAEVGQEAVGEPEGDAEPHRGGRAGRAQLDPAPRPPRRPAALRGAEPLELIRGDRPPTAPRAARGRVGRRIEAPLACPVRRGPPSSTLHRATASPWRRLNSCSYDRCSGPC